MYLNFQAQKLTNKIVLVKKNLTTIISELAVFINWLKMVNRSPFQVKESPPSPFSDPKALFHAFYDTTKIKSYFNTNRETQSARSVQKKKLNAV